MYNNKQELVRFRNSVNLVETIEDGIKFSDGTEISTYHSQDCCEHVYADWSYILENDFPKNIRGISISIVPNSGILLHFELGNPHEKVPPIFVPCYNEQNGYYSSNLELIASNGNAYFVVDVSEAAFDDIN